MQAYDYSRHTRLEPGTIRLFKLLPGRRTSELKGNLLVRRLALTTAEHFKRRVPFEEYQALSYTWGPVTKSTESIQILVESEEYFITINANLNAALRELRKETSPTYWWIDALCIDQTNVAEKNVQLPLMPQIFGSATKVVVWLGGEYENSSAAFTFLEQSLLTSDFDDFLQEAGRRDAFVGVVHLMKRPWFTRRWVIQEIASASRADLHCGKANMPWHAFVDAIEQIAAQRDSLRRAFSSLLANDPDDVENFSSLSTLKFLHLVDTMLRKTVDGRITEHLMTLEALLATTPQFESSDPRDTVYALLFLARDAEATTYEDWLARFRQRHKSLAANAAADTELVPGNTPQSMSIDESGEHEVEPELPPLKRARVSEQVSDLNDSPQRAADDIARAPKQDLRSVSRLGYALVRYLGLEAYGNRRAIMVDYKKSVLEICRDLMKFVINHSESIDMLCRPWAPSDMSLPSWVRTKAESAHLPGLNGVYRRVNADPLVGDPSWPVKPYRASSGTKASWSQQALDLHSLVLQGFVLDRIGSKEAIATAGIIPISWMKLAGWESTETVPPEVFWRTLVGNRNAQGQRAPYHWGQICAHAFARRLPGQDLDTSEAIRHDCSQAVRVFLERVQSVVWSRRLVCFELTKTLGLAPKSAKKGDLLCILKGCSVPVLLREYVDGQPSAKSSSPDPLGHFSNVAPKDVLLDQSRVRYEFIGEAYVHGMMDGEAYDVKHTAQIPPHSFDLR